MQTDFLKHELDALVHQTLERWHVPGLALAVVSVDEVLHLAGLVLKLRPGLLPYFASLHALLDLATWATYFML